MKLKIGDVLQNVKYPDELDIVWIKDDKRFYALSLGLEEEVIYTISEFNLEADFTVSSILKPIQLRQDVFIKLCQILETFHFDVEYFKSIVSVDCDYRNLNEQN